MNSNCLKCLYIHDHKFKNIDNVFFSEGKITDDVLSRYIDKNDKLTVMSRIESVSNSNGLVKITIPNVSFSSVVGINFINVFTFNILKNLRLSLGNIKESDFLVVRLPSFIGIFTLFCNIFIKKIYFIELVGDPKAALLALDNKSGLVKNVFIELFSKLNKYFIKKANGVIYVTESALQEKYPTKSLTSYASNVELDMKKIDLSFESYTLYSNPARIGLIGSFNNSYKGIAEAIEAISILKDSKKNVELHILGSGSLESHYKFIAKELDVNHLIFFDGILKGGEEVSEWLSSLDLYIQPSYTEGLPRALIEAMSVGLPVVATDVGGIPELLSKDTLIKPYDSEALSKKIKCFIDSQQLRFKQGKLNYLKSKEYDQEVLKQRRSEFWKAARNIVKRSLV